MFHLDAWQALPNTGRIQFSLDWAKGDNPLPINRLGSLAVDLVDYQLSRWTFNATAGDSRFRFTNLRQKFANAVYLDVFLRGRAGPALGLPGRAFGLRRPGNRDSRD